MNKHFTIESRELHLWEGSPSQVINLKYFILFGLGLLVSLGILPSSFFFGFLGTSIFAFLIFDKYIKVRDTRYDLTHERMRMVIGGLLSGRKTFEIDIDDLKDVELYESFVDQIFGLGTIKLIFLGDPLLSSYKDLYEKKIHILQGIQDSARSREIIRASIKKTVNRSTLNPDNHYNLNFDKQNKNNPKLLK